MEAREFPGNGAAHFRYAVDPAAWLEVVSHLPAGQAGVRIRGDARIPALISEGSAVFGIAASLIGRDARPVRAILFDKGPGNNWALGWHQDRTIAIALRRDCPGFGPWTIKQGIPHVEPPFPILEAMVTIRIHLDPVDANNAPLLFAPGSHLQGRIVEADYQQVLNACGVRTCLSKAGDVWAYATPILHSSQASTSVNRHRRVLQVDYSAQDLPHGLEWAGI